MAIAPARPMLSSWQPTCPPLAGWHCGTVAQVWHNQAQLKSREIRNTSLLSTTHQQTRAAGACTVLLPR